MWALPRRARLRAAAVLGAGRRGRSALAALTAPGAAWSLHALALWLWHAPPLYDLALRSDLAHLAEHVAFLGTGVLFWWPLLDPKPRVRARPAPAVRLGYLVLAAFQGGALGILIASSPSPLYAAYSGTPDALEDQALGGVLMWTVMGAVDMAGVLLTAWSLMGSALDAPRPQRAGPGPRTEETGAAAGAASRLR